MPFYMVRFSDEGYSYELIDAPKLLEYNDQKLLHPDDKKHGKFSNLNEILRTAKPGDNPIIVAGHLKSHKD